MTGASSGYWFLGTTFLIITDCYIPPAPAEDPGGSQAAYPSSPGTGLSVSVCQCELGTCGPSDAAVLMLGCWGQGQQRRVVVSSSQI